MELRRWQKKVIDEFPDIIKNYRKFILKAPTGAGKTVLAREIINSFYINIGKKFFFHLSINLIIHIFFFALFLLLTYPF